MVYRKTLLIFNPVANLGLAGRMDHNLRVSAGAVPGLTWVDTIRPGHATELAGRAAGEGYELVIAVGGDGTVHEVVNGLMQIPEADRPRLAVIPFGSGNDFSSAIGMDGHRPVRVESLVNGISRRVDVGRLVLGNGECQYWDNAIGIGFDTNVVIRSRRARLVRGFLIYLLAVFQTMAFDYEPLRLRVKTDREEWEQELLMLVLCNGGREGGVFQVAPQARPFDGLLQYVGVRRMSRPGMLRLLPEFMRGAHEKYPQVITGQFSRLELASDRPLHIHADGEILAGPGSDHRTLTVEILPQVLEVVTPVQA